MTGETKNAGWQVGVRRTLSMDIGEVWQLLTGQPWLRRWTGLDALDADDPAVRSLTSHELVRVRTPHSLVQLRLQSAATGTTIAWHEEHLPDAVTRERRKMHWTRMLDDLQSEAATEKRPPQSQRPGKRR